MKILNFILTVNTLHVRIRNYDYHFISHVLKTNDKLIITINVNTISNLQWIFAHAKYNNLVEYHKKYALYCVDFLKIRSK